MFPCLNSRCLRDLLQKRKCCRGKKCLKIFDRAVVMLDRKSVV